MPSKNLCRIHSRWRRFAISTTLSALLLAERIQRVSQLVRPRHLITPAIVAQFIIFVATLFIQEGRGLYIFTAGSLIVTGLAMLPSVFRRRKYHWVQRSDSI